MYNFCVNNCDKVVSIAVLIVKSCKILMISASPVVCLVHI